MMTGRARWQQPVNSRVHAPTLDSKNIYTASHFSYGRTVAARDQQTGATIWRKEMPITSYGEPIVAGGILYFFGTYVNRMQVGTGADYGNVPFEKLWGTEIILQVNGRNHRKASSGDIQ
ncbi:MAG: hypothetical protein EOP49_33610 [Sphingobacteriales bacterium]|nr:MAG: hypothetical protein EOP49_33610 [Sphingobacteriales bacterium]